MSNRKIGKALRKLTALRPSSLKRKSDLSLVRRKKSLSFRKANRFVPKKAATLGRMNNLEARLATNMRQIKRAQALRYKVFYEEMAAKPDAKAKAKRRDVDVYDRVCDHVLVFDHDSLEKRLNRIRPKLIGTYRLLRKDVADAHAGFYSEGEFNIRPLIKRHSDKNILELGRSCVLDGYRGKHTIELLWAAIWRYVLDHNMDVMLGCASFPATDLNDIADELSFLHHYVETPDEWEVRAHDHLYVDMNIKPKEEVNAKRALAKLPPLIKGYLRLGAYVGNGAIVDYQFGTTDVFMILPVTNISERYIKYFGADAERHAV